MVICSIMQFSCSKDRMEDRNIFIPDNEDPKLPAYTENGYNSFGAKYGNDYFLVSSRFSPGRVAYNNNRLNFSLHGTFQDRETRLEFIFPFELNPSDLTDLTLLKEKIIDLDLNEVRIFQNNTHTTLNGTKGKLHFKHAQIINIDNSLNRVILSGVFELSFTLNNSPATFSNGRFDVGITQVLLSF